MKSHKNKLKIVLLGLVVLAGLLCLRQALYALERAAYPRRYQEAVQQSAEEYGVDANLVYAIIRTESGFQPGASSEVGARGLMQITEETFAWIKLKIAPAEDITFDDLYTPEVNIRFGTYLLSVCTERYGADIKTAAAAYHSGLGMVDELRENAEYSSDGVTLHTFPYRQMNNYVNKVSRNYERYCALYPASAT